MSAPAATATRAGPSATATDAPLAAGWARRTLRNGLYQVDVPADWPMVPSGPDDVFLAGREIDPALTIRILDGLELAPADILTRLRPGRLVSEHSRDVTESEVTIDGRPAVQVSYWLPPGPRGEREHWGRWVGFSRDRRVWLIHAQMTDANRAQVEPAVAPILASFKVRAN